MSSRLSYKNFASTLLLLSSINCVISERPHFPTDRGCGTVNVFYTGFTAYHPYVSAQGYNGLQVDIGLKTDTVALVQAGYNVQVLFQGPEQPVSNIGSRMKGKEWDVTAEGFGIRGFPNATATRRFEDNLYEFQEHAPLAPTVFNWGTDSLAESVRRRVPLNEDCTGKPGTLYAYEEICDVTVCEKYTAILAGGLQALIASIPEKPDGSNKSKRDEL